MITVAHNLTIVFIGCSIKVAKAINDAGKATNSVIINPTIPKNVNIVSFKKWSGVLLCSDNLRGCLKSCYHPPHKDIIH